MLLVKEEEGGGVEDVKTKSSLSQRVRFGVRCCCAASCAAAVALQLGEVGASPV